MTDPLMYAPAVADRLQRTEAALRWMVHTGTAPKSVIIAGRRVWRESDVESFIAAAFEEAH